MHNRNKKEKKVKKKTKGEVYNETVDSEIKLCDEEMDKLYSMMHCRVPGIIMDTYNAAIKQWVERKKLLVGIKKDVEIELG